MKHANLYLGLTGALALVALTGCPNPGFPQPDGTIPVNFSIDASGRPGFYEDEDLEWKGAFTYDTTTRILTYDSGWAGGLGPYAPLYDDGPWTTGGHEPEGATAGDDRFGIAAFLDIASLPDPTVSTDIEYGAQTRQGGWIWPGGGPGSGGNGRFTVPANPTEESPAVTAAGFTLSPEGTMDVRLTLDTNALTGPHTRTNPVEVKGTLTGWELDPAYDDGTHGDVTSGDGIYTYVLSEATDPRRLKLASGASVEFIWNFGRTTGTRTCSPGSAGCGTEYKSGSSAATGGVAAGTRTGETGTFNAATVTVLGNGNTGFTVP